MDKIAVRTRINDPCARTLELPLLVWSGVIFFFLCDQGQIFGVLFAPFPEEEISDYQDLISHIINHKLALVQMP